MVIYDSIFLFIIGTVMGSFFHVVGSRLAEGKSIVKPGSHCTQCNHALKWYELIPIVSYLIQKGRCRVCHVKLSIWYPFIELCTGILYMSSYLLYGFTYDFWVFILISSLLIIVCVSDFNYLIIPDEALLTCILLYLVITFFMEGLQFGLHSLLSGLFLFLFMLLVKYLGDFLFKRDSMGGGDIKLSFFIGCVLGFKLSYIGILFGSILAFPFALLVTLFKKNREVPFGPFLLMGTLLAYGLSPYIQSFLSILF